MDESVVSGPSSSSDRSQAASSGSQGRFPSFNGPDLQARNILDETLDIEASGAATGDGLIDDEDYKGVNNAASSSNNRPVPICAASLNGKHAATGITGAELPVAELAALRIQDYGDSNHAATGNINSMASVPSSSSAAGGAGATTSSKTDNGNDELPTESPLSAVERREHSLRRERDDLAKMNTLLEQAIASIERTVPKFERFQETMKTSHRLLDTYTRILSQADHTQQLLLDGSWETQRDEDEIREEAEAEQRQRREEEERLRRVQREAEEREARAQEELALKAAKSTTSSTRGKAPPTRGTRGIPSARSRTTGSQRGNVARSSSRGRGTAL